MGGEEERRRGGVDDMIKRRLRWERRAFVKQLSGRVAAPVVTSER